MLDPVYCDPRYLTDYTRQREWVERRGFLLVLAFFFGGLGGGLYLISLYLNFPLGQIIGLLIVVVLKGGTHLAYLGRWQRFWRGFLRPQTSWISRGLITIGILVLFGVLQLAPMVPQFSWLPWDSQNVVIKILAALGAVGLIAYTGFALGVVSAIPFWNTAIMPVLFMAYSLLGGTGLTVGITLSAGIKTIDLIWLENLLRWLLVIGALLIGIFVWVSYATPTGKRSVIDLIKGAASPWFIGGVLIVGLAIPLIVGVTALFAHVPVGILLLAGLCELIGGFSLRYSILKAGIYAPVI